LFARILRLVLGITVVKKHRRQRPPALQRRRVFLRNAGGLAAGRAFL
jgi:hypothetical protein